MNVQSSPRIFKDASGRLLSLQDTDPTGIGYIYYPRIIFGYIEREFLNPGWTGTGAWASDTTYASYVGGGGIAFIFPLRRWAIYKFSDNDDTDQNKDSAALDLSNRQVILVGVANGEVAGGVAFNRRTTTASGGSGPDSGAIIFKWVTAQITGVPDYTWYNANSVEFYRIEKDSLPVSADQAGIGYQPADEEFILTSDPIATIERLYIPLSNFQENTHGIFIDFSPIPPETNDMAPLNKYLKASMMPVADALIY